MKAINILLTAQAALSAAVSQTTNGDFDSISEVDKIASTHISLRHVSRSHSRISLHQSLGLQTRDGDFIEADSNSTKLTNTTYLYFNNYIGRVKIGPDQVNLLIDTGSSDTWVLQKNFTCFFNNRVVGEEECFFGPTYNGTSSYGSVPDTAGFDIRYGDGTSVGGTMGYEDVTVGGVTVKKQELAFINESSYAGDKVTSGVLGFAFPITTRVFSSADETQRFPSSSTHRKYDPVFTSMVKQGLSPAVFSLAMDRNTTQGWLSFGGLPPVNYDASSVAKTPIRIVEADNATALKNELSYYTIVPDNIIYGKLNTSNLNYSNPSWTADGLSSIRKNQFPVILDSGTTLSILPEVIVKAYAKQFQRPVIKSQGNYWIRCDSKVPKFGVTIGGKTFYLNDSDLLVQEITADFQQQGETVTLCALGMMDILPDGPFIFGTTFLNSVISVFDVGATEMRFYAKK